MPETAVYLELGSKRVFASALNWPGWCRSGKTEAEALARLAEYAPRYRVAALEARVHFPREAGRSLAVVERIDGSGTTDFGVPSAAADLDAEPATDADTARLAALVAAAWTVLDHVSGRAPESLAKGPRGGGRDRDRMLQHVLGAEASYARQLGVRQREPRFDDLDAVRALRSAIEESLRVRLPTAQRTDRGWPPRYTARRIAWHVLDHAWEMEDRGALERRGVW